MSPRVGPAELGRPRGIRPTLLGLLALPLSLLPFLAYGLFTPEGRLLRDRLIVMVSPPHLPVLTAAEEARAVAVAPRYSGKVMALVYHGVGSSSDAEGGFVVSPRRFGEHLATLRAAGMQAVTAADVARAFTGGPALPENAVMITFDDGRADALMFADPLLEEAGMRATMFLISSATDRPGLYYAGWDRIERAARSGRWDIQAHTHDSHREEPAAGGDRLPRLTSLAPGESLAGYEHRIREDLDRNDDAIEEHIGRRPVAFAYPFGAYGVDRTNDPRIQEVLRAEISRRYLAAFHQDQQESVPLLDPGADRTGLRRLEVEDWSGAELLGRIADAAGGRPTGDPDPAELADLAELAELAEGEPVEPPTPAEPARPADPVEVEPRPTTSTRPGRIPTTRPRGAAPPTATTGSTPTTEASTTTSTEQQTTTTTGAWEEPATTTTGARPTTTTTTTERSTTTTRPSDTSTTTTTEKRCRGKEDKACRR